MNAEEQSAIDEAKEAAKALKSTHANTQKVLSHNEQLTYQLKKAISLLEVCVNNYIPPHVYIFHDRKRVVDDVKEKIEDFKKYL
jgi:hypothetical protein